MYIQQKDVLLEYARTFDIRLTAPVIIREDGNGQSKKLQLTVVSDFRLTNLVHFGKQKVTYTEAAYAENCRYPAEVLRIFA